jgi:hypothetical protein
VSRAGRVSELRIESFGLIEVKEMRKRNAGWTAKLICLALLAVALCFGPACKDSEEPAPPPQPPVEQAPAAAEESSAAAALAEAAKEEVEEVVEEVQEAVQSATQMVPLEIELPKPMFVGTPQDTRVPNLRKPTGKPRPPFLAPVGTRLLSLNKPVSASDEEPIIGDLEMITDGDKEAADGSYVELGPFLQWVQIDLEQQAEIAAIVVWHYHKQPRVYFDVVVQVSNDPDFITDVTTVFNNDIDNSSGLGIGSDMHYTETSEGELIDCVSQGMPKGRYVRLYSNGNTSNDLNHYIEVEVWGIPAE